MLLRGRGLIGVLACALLGLVFLQVSLLKLHTGITQNMERAQVLERDNAVRRAAISKLDAGRRIEDVAGKLGMVMPGRRRRVLPQRSRLRRVLGR